MMNSDNDEYLSGADSDGEDRNFDDYEALLNLDENVI